MDEADKYNSFKENSYNIPLKVKFYLANIIIKLLRIFFFLLFSMQSK